MAVKNGLKKTEIGVIPLDWEIKCVQELVDDSSPICYGVVQVGKNTGSGIPIVAIKYVKEILSAPLHRAHARLEKPYARSRVLENDVLISIKGTIGRVGIVPAGFKGNISRELARLRIGGRFSPKFIMYQLEANATQERIMRSVVGTTRLEFSIGAVRVFQLPLPCTKSEQEAIAEALSDADAWIESLEQLIAKKRQIKQGAMQELLTGKRRLPGFSGEWTSKRIGDLADLYQPITISADEFTESGFPVYGANGVVGFYSQANHLTWQVTITCRGSTCGTVNRTVDRCWITGNAMVINCESKAAIDKQFLYYSLSSQDLSICISGTGQPQIVRGPLSSFEIYYPNDIAEQSSIGEVLSLFDAEIREIDIQLAKARQIKQAMMQELLTGRIRLVNPSAKTDSQREAVNA